MSQPIIFPLIHKYEVPAVQVEVSRRIDPEAPTFTEQEMQFTRGEDYVEKLLAASADCEKRADENGNRDLLEEARALREVADNGLTNYVSAIIFDLSYAEYIPAKEEDPKTRKREQRRDPQVRSALKMARQPVALDVEDVIYELNQVRHDRKIETIKREFLKANGVVPTADEMKELIRLNAMQMLMREPRFSLVGLPKSIVDGIREDRLSVYEIDLKPRKHTTGPPKRTVPMKHVRKFIEQGTVEMFDRPGKSTYLVRTGCVWDELNAPPHFIAYIEPPSSDYDPAIGNRGRGIVLVFPEELLRRIEESLQAIAFGAMPTLTQPQYFPMSAK